MLTVMKCLVIAKVVYHKAADLLSKIVMNASVIVAKYIDFNFHHFINGKDLQVSSLFSLLGC